MSERELLIQRLKGRSEFCRNRGEIKTPELMEQAVKILEGIEGYKLVPLEPTERMLDSAYSSISDNLHYADLENIYKAMIGAVDD